MKVLLVATEKLPVPPVRGGAIQTYIAAVALLLGRAHQLTILGRDDPELKPDETVDSIRYVRVPGGTVDVYAEGVRAFIAANRFDLVQIYNRPRLVRPVREAAPGARLVLSMHNDMFLPQKIDPDEAAYAIEQVERILTVSDYVGRVISEMFPAAKPKLKTVYSGVDLQRFATDAGTARRVRDELRKVHGLEGKKVVLFVGRLSPKKGADLLVQAMPELAHRHPDAALVLVGSKWYSDDKISDYVGYVRAIAARSPLPVVSTGFVPADKVHEWFWAGDVFVCASQWEEPLARVHYEAMAAGLPMVTTARGGNPEVVQGAGNGLVVLQYDSAKALADALSQLLSDSGKAREMGRKGRALAEANYGWDRVARDVLAAWDTPAPPIDGKASLKSEALDPRAGAPAEPPPSAAPQPQRRQSQQRSSQAKRVQSQARVRWFRSR